MSISKAIRNIVFCTFFFNIPSAAYAFDDPCGGASALLNIVDRPTVGDSACVVPYKKVVLEAGYQYQQLTHSQGHQQNFPETELRIGFLANTEFVLVLPNEIRHSSQPGSGSSATAIGVKHEIGYNQYWIGSIESLITLPSGSAAYGSQGTGIAVNGIVGYTFNPSLNLSMILGGSTATTSSGNAGQRYSSINPDVVLTYVINPKLNLYGEIYGQSKTGPGEGAGFNADGGFLYLLASFCSVDIELGRRINGNLAGFNNYIGTGFALMI